MNIIYMSAIFGGFYGAYYMKKKQKMKKQKYRLICYKIKLNIIAKKIPYYSK